MHPYGSGPTPARWHCRRGAVADTILLPHLREEVESVVRQVVCEAVADEVATKSIGTFRKS